MYSKFKQTTSSGTVTVMLLQCTGNWI